MASNELSIKLLIDTKAQKVCFAEAGNDVFQFISCLLCLPMSTVVNLLTKERMVGSIGNVLDSVQKLDSQFVTSSKGKGPYLSPTIMPTTLYRFQQLLNSSAKFFKCPGSWDYCGNHIACGYFSAIKINSQCPSCSKAMDTEMPRAKPCGFVAGTATFTVMDDLSMTPSSSMSSITLLAKSGIKDLSTLQQKTVTIGREEALEILLASLKSKTVLSDVFLGEEKVSWKKEA